MGLPTSPQVKSAIAFADACRFVHDISRANAIALSEIVLTDERDCYIHKPQCQKKRESNHSPRHQGASI